MHPVPRSERESEGERGREREREGERERKREEGEREKEGRGRESCLHAQAESVGVLNFHLEISKRSSFSQSLCVIIIVILQKVERDQNLVQNPTFVNRRSQ